MLNLVRRVARLLPHRVRAAARRWLSPTPAVARLALPVARQPAAAVPATVAAPARAEAPEARPIFYVPLRAAAAGGVPEPVVDPGPTFVADSSSAIVDEIGLHYLFCAVFETPTLSGAPLRAFEFARTRPALWADRDALLAGVRGWFLDRLADGPDRDAETLAGLHALHRHRVTTRASAEAYATAGKPVPGAVFWPNPTHPHSSSIFEHLPLVPTHPLVTRDTPIGSAGSCFAMEIAYRLQRDGYNYVITETIEQNRYDGLCNACAGWGAIYNTPSFRQLVEKAFGRRALPKILWTRGHGGERQYLDPFREDVVFASVEEFEAGYESHLRAVREAFLRCKVFIFTLGMNEVWRLKADGTVFSRAPWNVMPDLVEPRVLTVEDNLHELQQMLDLLRAYNPEIKIILSVSPVPLHATFRGAEAHVITANSHSKATLRVVAEAFAARNAGVYYFPSYETVMHCTRNPWQADQRHVSPEAVDNVMRLFRKMFVAEAADTGDAAASRAA